MEVTPKTLKEALVYNNSTGELFWRNRPLDWFADDGNGRAAICYQRIWNTRYAGKPAFVQMAKNGYLYGSMFGKRLMAHRVVWAMVHGRWPPQETDHINGIKDDNRVDNLRAVSMSENSRNSKLYSNNTSGVPGVYWCSRGKNWFARVFVNKRSTHLGMFSSKKDAIAARKDAEKRYGYHENHGRPV